MTYNVSSGTLNTTIPYHTIPGVCPWARNGRLWEASVAAFQEVVGSITVSCCLFHYSQAISKRVKKLRLNEDYQKRSDIKNIRYILDVQRLPAADNPTGLQEIRATICNDIEIARQLQQLVTYVQRQWIDFHRLLGHVWQMWSLSHSTTCWCDSADMRHSCFCASCANTVASMDSGCPICRTSVYTHGAACIVELLHWVDSDGFLTARIRIRRTEQRSCFPTVTVFNVFHIVLHWLDSDCFATTQSRKFPLHSTCLWFHNTCLWFHNSLKFKLSNQLLAVDLPFSGTVFFWFRIFRSCTFYLWLWSCIFSPAFSVLSSFWFSIFWSCIFSRPFAR